MVKLPVISGQNAVKRFEQLGYKVIRQRGSHVRLYHPKKKPLTIPVHKELGKGLLKRLLRDANITIEKFIQLH